MKHIFKYRYYLAGAAMMQAVKIALDLPWHEELIVCFLIAVTLALWTWPKPPPLGDKIGQNGT